MDGRDGVEGAQHEPRPESGRGAQAQSARARLWRLGAAVLGDAELVAVVLGEGASTRGPSELAVRLVEAGGGLRQLCSQDAEELCELEGLGPERASRLAAAVELGRRALQRTEARPRLRTPDEIFDYLAPRLCGLRREVFHVLSFNSRNVLLSDFRAAEGTMNACPVDPREVFGAALRSRATALVLAHNHPSGDPQPSQSDLELTWQLSSGAALLGIRVLDHLILGDWTFASLAQRGQLEPVSAEQRRVHWGALGGG